jgi:DNA repair protein RecO (recombination protein O)
LPVQKTKAIVFGSHLLGEADKITAFYTRDFGEIRAVARGSRKVKNRLCGRLELLMYGDFIFFEKENKDLHIVNSFDVVEPFQELRDDLLKMAYCSYLAELIQQIESLGIPNPYVFDMMLNIMLMMKASDDPEMLVRAFEIRLLTNAGFSPQLDSCVSCSSSIDNLVSIGFDVHKGGILCSKCSEPVSNITISRGTLEIIKRMQRSPLELISRLRMSEANRTELRRTLKAFLEFHAGIGKLKSLDFLESIENDVCQSLGIS